MRFGTKKNGIAMFHPEKAVTWTSLWIFLIALAIDCSEIFLERHMNVSFQFITIKVEVSTHENDASDGNGIDSKKALECPNIVRFLKMMAFSNQ